MYDKLSDMGIPVEHLKTALVDTFSKTYQVKIGDKGPDALNANVITAMVDAVSNGGISVASTM
jgi:hypothetical protein